MDDGGKGRRGRREETNLRDIIDAVSVQAEDVRLIFPVDQVDDVGANVV